MDPSSFTKTSFCNIEIDNIKINNGKVGKISIELRNLYFKNF